MSSTDWYKTSEQVLSTVNNKIIWLKNQDAFKHYCSTLVSCPVNIEVYNSKGNLVATIYDGKEESGVKGELYYDVKYNPIDGDYDKIIHLPDKDGYLLKIIGTDTGKVDCRITSIMENGSIKARDFNNVTVVKNDILRIDNISGDKNEYYIIRNNDRNTPKKGIFNEEKNGYVAVESIIINPPKIELKINSKIPLSVECKPSNASVKTGYWTSSDKSIAEVNKDGVVTARKVGTAIIKCVSYDSDSIYDSCVVKVINSSNAKTIKTKNTITKTVNKKTIKLKKLKKKAQSFKISGKAKEKAKLTYKLSKVPKKAKKYIKVSKAGKVTVKKGLKKGTYKIKVKITAAETKSYKKTTVMKTIKIVVKK